MIKHIVLKIAALFSFCGGPLFVADLLKPRFGSGPAFLITFLPVGLMLFGAFFLDDDPRDRMSSVAVRAGTLGLYIALSAHLYALWCFASGVRVAEQYLYYFGIAVGVAWSFAYLRAVRRRAAPPGGSAAGERTSREPIEPS